MAKVTKLKIGLQSGSSNTIYASWSFSGKNLDYYKVDWYYSTGNGVAFSGGTNKPTVKNDTYSLPSNAKTVKVVVKPVAKTHKVNGKDTYYWSGESVSASLTVSNLAPEKAATPTVSIDKYKLTVYTEIDMTDTRTKRIQFHIVKDNVKFLVSDPLPIKSRRVTFTCNIKAGGTYRVCCRGVNIVNNKNIYGPWSDYSGDYDTIPAEMSDVTVSVQSKTSVKLSWKAVPKATSYDIQYTTNKKYFDSSSDVSSATSDTYYAFINGIEPGSQYYFRVRAKNDQGETGWSKIVTAILGTDPIAPTTWSSTTTAMVGENVTLYWTHNSEDGSKQTAAEIEVTAGGTTKTYTVTYDTEDDDDKNDTFGSYVLDLSSYTSGAEILWRVRTKGVTDVFGEWSVQRTVHLYAPPTLTVNFVNDTELVTAFPCRLIATAGPDTQKAVSFQVTIKATETYETDDETGTWNIVKMGETIYSKAFNATGQTLDTEISAGDVIFKNNQTYQLIVVVGMDSGLTAEVTETFEVSWGDDVYEPDAEISIDEHSLCSYIFPFCRDENDTLISDVVLSVYRREYNGTLTLIEKELTNDGTIGVLDMHPALNYARYRIVARNKNTSVVGYTDLPGYPVNKPYIVIQWDESFSKFNYEETEDELEIAPYSSSMVCLPYNIDTTESNDKDVSLVEYIGRKHPVGYYGTQIGETATWSTEIEADDDETLYALRRLKSWMDNCYVREPSGVGYWAEVSVSFNKTHCELTIPVTFTIKHVEGGA